MNDRERKVSFGGRDNNEKSTNGPHQTKKINVSMTMETKTKIRHLTELENVRHIKCLISKIYKVLTSFNNKKIECPHYKRGGDKMNSYFFTKIYGGP